MLERRERTSAGHTHHVHLHTFTSQDPTENYVSSTKDFSERDLLPCTGGPLRAGSRPWLPLGWGEHCATTRELGLKEAGCPCPLWQGMRHRALRVQHLSMLAGGSQGCWGGGAQSAGQPGLRQRPHSGRGQSRGGQGLTLAVPALLWGIQKHISCLHRNPGNCPRHLGVSKRFKTCLGELESTLVSQSGDRDSLIGDLGHGA